MNLNSIPKSKVWITCLYLRALEPFWTIMKLVNCLQIFEVGKKEFRFKLLAWNFTRVSMFLKTSYGSILKQNIIYLYVLFFGTIIFQIKQFKQTVRIDPIVVGFKFNPFIISLFPLNLLCKYLPDFVSKNLKLPNQYCHNWYQNYFVLQNSWIQKKTSSRSMSATNSIIS